MRPYLALLLIVSLFSPALAQTTPVVPAGVDAPAFVDITPVKSFGVALPVDEPETIVERRSDFRPAFIRAVKQAADSGKISRLEAVRLRVASFSPAFVERARDLCVVQIAFSGEVSDKVPVDDSGKIDVEGINWDGLIKFIEALVPIILMILDAFK